LKLPSFIFSKYKQFHFENFLNRNKILKNHLLIIYLPLPAATHSILDFVRSTPRRAQLSSCSTTGSSDCSNKSLSIDQFPLESPLLLQQQQQQLLQAQSTSIEMVCSTMRRQIISRAFYGWLAYCRHLSTVRTHLSGLVHGRITPESELARLMCLLILKNILL